MMVAEVIEKVETRKVGGGGRRLVEMEIETMVSLIEGRKRQEKAEREDRRKRKEEEAGSS